MRRKVVNHEDIELEVLRVEPGDLRFRGELPVLIVDLDAEKHGITEDTQLDGFEESVEDALRSQGLGVLDVAFDTTRPHQPFGVVTCFE